MMGHDEVSTAMGQRTLCFDQGGSLGVNETPYVTHLGPPGGWGLGGRIQESPRRVVVVASAFVGGPDC